MKYEKLVEFGRNVRIERAKKAYSLEKLGLLAHLNPSHIAKIERGEMSPTLPTILSLMEALDVKFENLVSP